jgi:phosphatidylglycerophosphate synthase
MPNAVSISLSTGVSQVNGKFTTATRIQESMLAATEKKTLLWLANRLPLWINSDHLTALGLLALMLAGGFYAGAKVNPLFLALATLCLFVNWFGDSLDGTLARVRNRQRPRYGFYVDHVTDAIGAFFLMGGLALSGYIHPAVAISMLVAFLLLSIEVFLATYTLGAFHLSFWGFGPTEIRILLAIGNGVLLIHPYAHIAGQTFLLFDVGGLIASAGMFCMFIVSTIKHSVRLYREERLP